MASTQNPLHASLSACAFPASNGTFPYSAPGNWAVKAMRMDEYFHPVYAPGDTGLVWNEKFSFDHVDNGAMRVKFHSDYDGLFVHVTTGSMEGNASIDPFRVVVDREGYSEIRHNGRVLTQVQGARFPKGKPVWVWLTYVDGLLTVGFGRNPGEGTFMQAQESPDQLFGGGYCRFALGKTGNTGAFELLDVQPLERNKFGNVNLRGTGFYE
jgi:hypothetical protein